MCVFHVFFPLLALKGQGQAFLLCLYKALRKETRITNLTAACWSTADNSGIKHFLMLTNSPFSSTADKQDVS